MLILAQIQPQINFLLIQMSLLYKKPLSSFDFNLGPVCYHLVRRLFEPHILIEVENIPFTRNYWDINELWLRPTHRFFEKIFSEFLGIGRGSESSLAPAL
jgi:hypothetical protein